MAKRQKRENDITKTRNMASINKGTLKRLLQYIWKYNKLHVIFIAIGLLCTAFSMIVANVFLQKIIDDCIKPGLVLGWDAVKMDLFRIGGVMIGIFILGIFMSFLNNRLFAIVTPSILYRLRKDMFNKMESLPIKYFDTNKHGAIMSTYTNDTDTIRMLMEQALPTFYQSSFGFILSFVIMMYYSVYLTLIVVAFIILSLVIVKIVGGINSKYMVAKQSALAKTEGFVEEMIKGQKVVKVFNHENIAKQEFTTLNNNLFNNCFKANKYGNLLMPILSCVGNILYVILALVGGLMVVYGSQNVGLSGIGTLSIGIMVAYLSLSRQISQTARDASSSISMLTMGLAGASRVFKLIDETPEVNDGNVFLVNAIKDENGNIKESENHTGLWAWKIINKEDNTTSFVELNGEIEMVDVNFGYEENQEVLNDISLKALSGQKVALVGATGAGKTTITNLLNRFYDIEKGNISYDGIDVKHINKDDLRESLGIVLQDTNLFTGTVMENIRYGRLDATDDECIEASKLANAHSFISRLPEGYQTLITNNGSNLSQGQRQLLSIARAAVADPPVMILDEATSSIDTRTETLVQNGMDNLMKGRTVFVIAHRLSTIKNADSIIVLDHGRIIEKGNHEKLMNDKKTYYQLYTGSYELQ